MKIKMKNFCAIAVLGLIMFSFQMTLGQELENNNPMYRRNIVPTPDDKIQKADDIERNVPQNNSRTQPVKTVRQQPNKSEEKSNNVSAPAKSGESGESVLSFNVLYYMIQKYKFTEVSDQ